MDHYTDASYELSRSLTQRYSTSFSLSSRLLDESIRRHIYAIYGLVRLADEIVDTYRGRNSKLYLTSLQREVYDSMKNDFSVNPIVHAFASTARQYGIDTGLVDSFFESMRMDLQPQVFDQDLYERYVYGSAEVVGLMCLRVFVEGNKGQFAALAGGARALGAAYQKVNFLRDMKADHEDLGRIYFPGITFETFSEEDKKRIVADIEDDFLRARQSIDILPVKARRAVRASYRYYEELLSKLSSASVTDIKSSRLRVGDGNKLVILARSAAGR